MDMDNIRVRIESDVSKAQGPIRQLTSEVSNLKNALKNIPKIDVGVTDADTKTVQETGKKAVETARNASKASTAFAKFGSVAKSVSGTIGKGLLGHLKNLGSMLPGLGRSTNKLGSTFKTGFWAVMKYALGIRSLYFLFRKLRQAIKDGFGNLRQYSAETNANLNALTSSFTTFKNALAVAFNPILSVITPILQTLIEHLVTAGNAVGRFFSALTGKSFAVQAIKGYQGVAKSASGVGSAAKKAAKDAKKLNDVVLGIDELNINKGDDDTDTSSPGGGGGSGSGAGVDYNNMFETVKVDERMKDLARRIKEAWKTGDFTSLGKDLGTAIKKGLDNIPWEKIKKTVNKASKSLATFLNGILSVKGLGASVGKTVAEFYNTYVGAISTFIGTFDWKQLGSQVTSGLQSFIQNIDWHQIGEFFSNGFKGLFNFITGAIQGVDWEQLPTDIFNAVWGVLSGFDWLGTLKSIGGLISSAVFAGIDFGKGLWKLLNTGLTNLYPLLQAFDGNVAKIAQTTWNKIKAVFATVVTFFKEKFETAKQKILEAWQNIPKWFGEQWRLTKEAFALVKEFFKEKFENGYQAVKNAFTKIGSWFGDRWQDVKKVFDGGKVKKFFKEGFGEAYDAVTGIFDEIGGYFKGIANDIIAPIGKAVNGVIDGINWILGKVGSKKTLAKWDVPKFAKGTSGLNQDTVGMVNDQKGSTYREMVIPPHGEPFVPEGRNVILPMEKGTRIIPAKETQTVGKLPKFAKGVGDFFGGAWAKLKDFTGNIADYLSSPSKILQIALDKFIDTSSWTGTIGNIATGAINTVFDAVVSYIKKALDSASSAKVEKAVQWAVGIANNNSHGYDQEHRWGPDYDCSSLVISAFQNAGIGLKSAGAVTTHNMESAGAKIGFKDVVGSVSVGSGSGLKRGDILLNTQNHTALYMGNGQMVQARMNEFNGIKGGKPGDQTGREIMVGGYANFSRGGWDSVLRYSKFARGLGFGMIPQFADGGYPENGLFMASDDELIGQFKDRNAVANNYQIESGIERAAYTGFLRAMTESNTGPILEELLQAVKDGKRIFVDGRELTNTVNQRNVRNGYSFT